MLPIRADAPNVPATRPVKSLLSNAKLVAVFNNFFTGFLFIVSAVSNTLDIASMFFPLVPFKALPVMVPSSKSSITSTPGVVLFPNISFIPPDPVGLLKYLLKVPSPVVPGVNAVFPKGLIPF